MTAPKPAPVGLQNPERLRELEERADEERRAIMDYERRCEHVATGE